MPREVEEYEDDGEIEALHRFLSDQQTYKTVLSLVSIFMRAQHNDDDTVDEIEYPDIRRNDQILLMKRIFELMEEMVGGPMEDEEFEEEASAHNARTNKVTRFLELAKDKKMSAYYKAFMGNMRGLVGPWHSDPNKWLGQWMKMGMDLYEKSPGEEPETKLKLVLKRQEDSDDDADESVTDNEEAAIIGGGASLPVKVARNIGSMGFEVIEAEEGDSAWAKNGSNEGFPDRQVVLVRRADLSYLVILSTITKHDTYGKPIKRKTLGEETSDEQILRILAYYYDMLNQE